MATFNGIEITHKLRPCIVNGCKALFHRWADRADTYGASPLVGGRPAGQYWNVFGIVEFEDGRTASIPIGEIRFLDTKGLMVSIDFAEG